MPQIRCLAVQSGSTVRTHFCWMKRKKVVFLIWGSICLTLRPAAKSHHWSIYLCSWQTLPHCRSADLTFGGERGFLVPQRKPTTFPRGTILILTLGGGSVGVVTASRGSVAGNDTHTGNERYMRDGWTSVELSDSSASVSPSHNGGETWVMIWTHQSTGRSAVDSSSSWRSSSGHRSRVEPRDHTLASCPDNLRTNCNFSVSLWNKAD